MGSDFTYTATTTESTLTASPTNSNEVGTFVLRFKFCLQNYPTKCGEFDSTVTITPCVLTNVKVV